MNLPDHGANPHRLYEKMKMEIPSRILDFSENVHPYGPPGFLNTIWPEMQDLVTRYPDPDAEPFRSKAAEFHGLPLSAIAVGNGAAEIFTWLARRYRSKRVVLIEPAFSEYRKTLEAENVGIKAVQATAEEGWQLPLEKIINAVEGCAALYICNPYNPTGLLASIENLEKLAAACRKSECELVIDEAFIDFIGEEFSIIPYLPHFSNLIIVRSMTKMYAIPGLRLGYVVAAPDLISELKTGSAQWNVNALSAVIGARCFSEETYRRQVIQSATEERQKMMEFLTNIGCRVTKARANFLSFQLPDPSKSDQFFSDMLKRGIVLRHTLSFKGMEGRWFRIGMKSAASMEELREEVTKWLKDA